MKFRLHEVSPGIPALTLANDGSEELLNFLMIESYIQDTYKQYYVRYIQYISLPINLFPLEMYTRKFKISTFN